MQRKMAVIVVADIVGYSRLMEVDEEGTLHRLHTDLHNLIEPKLAQHHGRLVKTTGDGILAEFQSVVDAVRFSLDHQRAIAERNEGLPPDRRLAFRIGVNLGDVIVEDGDLYGNGVNVAARLETLADPGGVMISGTAYDQLKKNIEAGFQYLGEQRVKNIAEPVRVYRVLMDPKDAGRRTRSAKTALWKWSALAAGIISICLMAGAAWLLWRDELWRDEPERSIAVLPFKNLSNDAAQDYLADGITEDLTTDLARIPGLFVTSRNAAFSYKGKDVNPTEVAAELGVRHILEGSIRRLGDDLRINAQLIDAESGGHLWAERFDGTFVDVLTLQDRVIAEIAAALELRLSPTQELDAGGTGNPTAYDAYLHGLELFRRHWHSGTAAADLKAAMTFFQRAIALDPNYGRAYGGLGQVYQMAFWLYAKDMGMTWEEARDKAYETRQEALKHPSAWGYRLAARYPKSSQLYDEAIENLARAVALDPSDPENYHQMAYWLILAGRVEDGQTYIDAARRVDPRSDKDLGYVTAAAEFSRGRYAEAAAAAEKDQVNYPNDPANCLLLAAIYGNLGRLSDAQQQYAKATELYDEDESYRPTLVRAREEWPFKKQEDAARLSDGLTSAGVGLPFGFDPASKDRMAGNEIKSLLLGHTIRARNIDDAGETATTVFAADGKASRTRAGLATNGYAVPDDQGVCIWWEKAMGCAVIFRNPNGSRDQGDEFIWITEWSRWFFIVE